MRITRYVDLNKPPQRVLLTSLLKFTSRPQIEPAQRERYGRTSRHFAAIWSTTYERMIFNVGLGPQCSTIAQRQRRNA